MNTIRMRLVILLVIGLAGAPFAAFSQTFAGDVVEEIRFESDTNWNLEPLSRIVTVEQNAPLTMTAVRDSIRKLFATGDYRDVVVDVSRGDRGAIVTFRISVHYRIGSITFEGVDPYRDRADVELLVHRDEVLSLNGVDRSADAIRQMLVRNGYLGSTVDPEVRFLRAQNTANLIFYVELGPRATVRNISFDRSPDPFTADELLSTVRLKPGDLYVRVEARRDAERMTDYLIRKDFRTARVRFVREVYDDQARQVDIEYEMRVGPRIRVEITGLADRTIDKILRFESDTPYGADVTERARTGAVEHLQKQGFFFSEVELTIEESDEEMVLRYVVKTGGRATLGDFRFDGASAVSPKELEDLLEGLQSGPVQRVFQRLLRRGSATTSRELSGYRDAIEAHYRIKGFNDARVGRPVAERVSEETFDVVFPIFEGPQTIVSSVRIEGVEQVAESRIPSLKVRDGDPLNPQLVAEDVVGLKTFYARDGFADIQVTPIVEFEDDRTGVDLSYRVEEGTRFRFGEILVRGNSYTRSQVVLKKSRLERGDPFSFLELLESQRNLYSLGIFQQVDLQPRPSAVNPAERDVVVVVEEGKALTVSGALGYATEDGFRGTASISHRNLWGTGRYLGLEGTVSERVSRFVLTYREPFIFNYDIPTQLTVFRREEKKSNGEALIESLGTFVEATRRLGRDLGWSLRYEYRVVQCVVQSEGDLCDLATGELPIEGLPKEDQEIEISSITPSIHLDRRNDSINPTGGYYAAASLEYAFPFLRAETEFVKGFVQGAWYRKLSTRTQFVTSARVGLVEPLSSTQGVESVPFAERFTAGGETTHRAFDFDELGVPCMTLIPDPTSIPEDVSSDAPCSELAKRRDVRFIGVGGNSLLLANVELRFPLYGESLRGALFLDAGNVWAGLGDIDPNELRYGVGVGVRYLTPVGPLRLDYGYKLDRKPFEDPGAVFLTLGYAF